MVPLRREGLEEADDSEEAMDPNVQHSVVVFDGSAVRRLLLKKVPVIAEDDDLDTAGFGGYDLALLDIGVAC